MKKELLIILALIMTIGLATILWVWSQGGHRWDIDYQINTDTSPKSRAEMIQAVEATNTKNANLYNTAIRDHDPALCDGISVISKQGECRDMIRAADIRKGGQESDCQALSDTGVILICHDAITSDIAIAQGNTELCQTISNPERAKYCHETIDETRLRSHIEAHTVTQDFCDTLVEKYQVSCIAEIRERDESDIYARALAADDTVLCQTITTIDLRTTCMDTILLKKASQTNNATLCNGITDLQKRTYCETQVSKMSDVTIYKASITGTDPNACTQISNENLRNKCHDTIIISLVKSSANTALCSTLTNTGIIPSCQQIGQ